MKNRLLSAALAAAILLCAPPGQAQVFGDAPATAEKFGGKNTQLTVLLDLQYQMQLLKRLIEHERSVNGIVQAAVSIGLNNPAIPTPDETLCSQVPANIPCAQAYAQMYPDFSVTGLATPAMPPLAAPETGHPR